VKSESTYNYFCPGTEEIFHESNMVLEKIIAYTSWGRGDSNIVYIDGVAPPTSPSSSNTLSSPTLPSSPLNANEEYVNDDGRNNGSSYTDWMSWKNPKTLDKNKQISCPPTPTSTASSLVGFGGKLNTNHHLKLLQTIREQDEGESRGDTGTLSINNKARRIGRCHSAPYSNTSSSQSSDEESDQTIQNKIRENGVSEPENTFLDNAPSLLENWVAHNDRTVGSMNDGSSLYQVNGHIRQFVETETREIKGPNANCLPPRKDSGVETCDESSLSGSSEDSASRKSSIESVSSTSSTDSALSTGSSNDVVMSDESTESTTMPAIKEDHIPNGTIVEKSVELLRSTSTPNGVTSESVTTTACTNNNSLPKEVSMEELELLKKLEAANRLIETDAKSLNSLGGNGHSRRSSDTSQISVTSGSSNATTAAQDNSQDSQISSSTNGMANSEEELWLLWGKILNEWEVYTKRKASQVKELVRSGIPHHFRGMAWQLLCGAHDSVDKVKYSEYIKSQSACEKVIRRDIARTYPEHDFFKKKDGIGQEALFNVMKAYSIHDREVGYCQGTAFIVGLLLMQMPEEDSFAVLVRIMQNYRMREMFKPSMAELGLCMYQLDMLVQEHIPDLSAHFQSQAIHTNLYASSWFLTLFTTSLPIALSCRIMDCFLLDGIEVIFRLAISLLLIGKPELLVQDMEGVIRYFQKEMPANFESDPDEVINLAYSLKINQKRMKKMEKEYTTMKTKEKEDEIELKRLRTESRLLRQRCDMLEQESCNLADRLIQGQVTRAEVEEDTFAIKRELAAIKQHDIDTNSQLESARDRIRKLSDMVERSSPSNVEEEVSLKTEILKQKEEMIQCLQDELIKVRLAEAENDENFRELNKQVSELEQEKKKLREAVPDNDIACLQEELAAAKLREAEANLALKDLRAKVAELSTMWQKHLKRSEDTAKNDQGAGDKSSEGGSNFSSLGASVAAVVPSTPKRLFNSLIEGKSDTSRLEEELMTSRLAEVQSQAELKHQRLKVMELETQNQVITNQLKRQNDEVAKLREALDAKNVSEYKLQSQLREAGRKHGELESRMKEDIMMARIRDAENTQCMAELTQKISSLEYKNQEMLSEGDVVASLNQSDKVRELQDKIASLRAQSNNFQLPTPMCTPVVEYKLFAPK